MSRGWNSGCWRTVHCGERSQVFNGIKLVSAPRKGYTGYWTTENKRVVLRRKGSDKTNDWELLVDGYTVGTGYRNLREMVSANEWAIRKAL